VTGSGSEVTIQQDDSGALANGLSDELQSSVVISASSDEYAGGSTGDPAGPAKLTSGCLVTRRAAPQAHLPKKKVSIRLPEESSSSRATFTSTAASPPPPVDLRVVRVQVLEPHDHRRALSTTTTADTIRRQPQNILVAAHGELTSRAPELCDTVELLFQPSSATSVYLASLSGEDLWRLLLHLQQLLFKVLAVDVPYFETSLFMLHTFLLCLSRALESLAGFEHFPACFRDLVSQCQKTSYSDHVVCLAETQSLYLVFERAVVSHLTANPDTVLPAANPKTVLYSSAPTTVSKAASLKPATVSFSSNETTLSQSLSTNPATASESFSTNPGPVLQILSEI
jgi:hypothetical protein